METIERIHATAHNLFKQYGLRSVTMSDIATELGISKKTIYNYYTDKDTLVDVVVTQLIAHNQHCCNIDQSRATSAIHEIFLALEMMQKTLADMNPTLVYDLKKYYTKSYQKFENFKTEYLANIIKTNLNRGIQEELYRPDVDVEIITLLRLHTMMFSFSPEIVLHTKRDNLYIEMQIILHFLYGIATPKGYKLIQKYLQQKQHNSPK